MKNARKPLAGLIALGTALAMPMAFAQDSVAAQDAAAAQSATAAQPAPQSPQTAAPQQAAQPLTWADVDADGDGKLSKEEEAPAQSHSTLIDLLDTIRKLSPGPLERGRQLQALNDSILLRA